MISCCVFLQGIAASQKAISSYCSVHRLLLALADHYDLWDEASNRLDAFLSSESNRTKVRLLPGLEIDFQRTCFGGPAPR